MSIGMPPSDERIWAKEMCLDAIENMIIQMRSDHVNILYPEEEQALKKQYARIAKFLGLPAKRVWPILEEGGNRQ